jgi:hypothetical protein
VCSGVGINVQGSGGKWMVLEAFGAGRGTVWGCFSLRYKLHMHVLERNIYGDSMLRDIVVLHFENHPLAPPTGRKINRFAYA